MKPETEYSFIDLAATGRTDWWATALTILLIASMSVLSTLGVLMFSGWALYFNHFSAAAAVKSVVTSAATPLGLLAFWIACRTIWRRPFLSLVSVDLTFSVRRCVFGAALFLVTNLLALAAMVLYASMRYGTWMIPFGQPRLPNGVQIFAATAAIIAIPLLAFAEELFFRGWMTQTLRQYLRFPPLVVTVVAVVFAAYHTRYDFHMKALIFAASFGFSALSLRDQRLELAIGAHSMLNICVALERLFFTGQPHASTSVPTTTFDWLFLIVLKGVLPFALMYWFLQQTNGWCTPKRATKIADAQRV
jgi:membrane protease YdiL (CAAX protease family)